MSSYTIKSAVEAFHAGKYVVLPSYQSRKTVSIGRAVRLIFEENGHQELAWVKVTEKSTVWYTGRVRFRPYDLKHLKRGAIVKFLPRDILNISSDIR